MGPGVTLALLTPGLKIIFSAEIVSRGYLKFACAELKPQTGRLRMLTVARMAAGALRRKDNAGDNEEQQYCRRHEAAEIQPAVVKRLVRDVAQRGAQGAGHDESQPESRAWQLSQ